MAEYSLGDLLYLMRCLRHPEKGCPWDLKQTLQSIVPHTLEEAYEVADAIERNDLPHLEEELGDLLFQVIFYAQIGMERSAFDFASIVDGLVKKLIRRHPHVFPDGTLSLPEAPLNLTDAEISQQWQAIKAQEKALKGESDSHLKPMLSDIPLGFSGLTRSLKMQQKAAGVGFDWGDPLSVLEKLEEELAEVREAIEAGDMDHVREEIGDLLFAQVNLARHLKIDPETALRETQRKFERRFGFIESQVLASGKDWESFTLEQLESWWQGAKEKGL